MIRPARPDDVEALAALENQAFASDAWSPAQVEAELTGANRCVVVAEVGGLVIGYAAIAVAGDVADLTRIVVAESERRAGVASALLSALHDAARQAGAERVLLEVAETNAGALAFYAARDYREITRRPGYYANGDGAIVFARALA